MSSLTRASDARDARRSHRSVEGDEKPHKMRERERQTATKPRYYIRGIEITAQTGLGRDRGRGGGLALDFEHQNHAVHMGLGRASWHGTQGLPPPFDGLSARPVARRFRADPHEIGRIEGIGPDLWKPVSSSTMASTSRSAPVSSSTMTSTSRAAPVSSLTRASTSRAAGELVDQGQRRPRHRPGYIPAYGVVDDPPPSGLAITRPRRPPLTPLGRGR